MFQPMPRFFSDPHEKAPEGLRVFLVSRGAGSKRVLAHTAEEACRFYSDMHDHSAAQREQVSATVLPE